jgi:hypothetical protein
VSGTGERVTGATPDVEEMGRLVRDGLFGAGLVVIDSPELVGRYNACLQQLGIEPTQLTSFRIDGLGWSPEIAHEKGDNRYLCAGVANPMGVIVSPSQRGKPIYSPYNSYDRRMLDAYFDRHYQSIADITATTYVGLDIDQELTHYESPRDLLLVRYIVVRSIAGGLFDAARDQRGLIDRFMADDLAWLDPRLRAGLVESARQWGDLRYRRLEITPLRFDVWSFHTQAFGGVFVLRCLKNGGTMLVVEDGVFVSEGAGEAEEFAITNPALLDRLQSEHIVEIDWGWYRAHPEVLADKKLSLLADAVCDECPGLDFAALKLAQKRQHAARTADRLPAVYHELERVAHRIDAGRPPTMKELSPALRLALLRPHRRLDEAERDVVWLLLCRLQPSDALRLYMSDKDRFFTQYQTWSTCKREWAIDLIKTRYLAPNAPNGGLAS